jgi:hypothetical protein
VKLTFGASDLVWSNCTFTADTLAGGALEIHWTSALNGTITGSGLEFTTNFGAFGSCRFTLGAGTSLGTVTGSGTGNAVFDINAAVSRTTGICPSTMRWNTAFTVQTPTPLHVTAS